jgi:hypothetical protein
LSQHRRPDLDGLVSVGGRLTIFDAPALTALDVRSLSEVRGNPTLHQGLSVQQTDVEELDFASLPTDAGLQSGGGVADHAGRNVTNAPAPSARLRTQGT